MKSIKKIIMLITIIIALTAITISFHNKYDSLIKEFEIIINSKQTAINDYTLLSTEFISDMTIYGNNFFEQGENEESEIYSMLKYNSDLNSYNLDAIAGTEYEKNTGNLIGMGTIPEYGEKRKELNLAIKYNEFFSEFYNRFPNVAWLYYTSDNNFRSIYPWDSSKKFGLTGDLNEAELYKCASPENNPFRKAVWTPLYLDHAGKGLMVTLSSPIYHKDNFKGVVSLDLTNDKLSKIINSEYETYLIDDTESVIAAGQNIKNNKEAVKLNTLLKASENDIEKMKMAPGNSVQRVGGYYIYKVGFSDAPWTMLAVMPVSLIMGKCLLSSLPILFVCIFLLFAINEVEIRKRTEEILKNIAITDQLTGLNNRHYFGKKVEEEMEHSDRYNRPLSMIIFDLDYFKRINDIWGHPVGDEVLKQTAEITSSLIRKTDMIFRWGGEEFIILMPETTLSGAKAVAEKLRDALERNIHPVAGKFTASFGVGERLRDESIKSWYKNVDKALYYAKSGGRNRVVATLEQEVTAVTTIYIKWKSEWESGNKEIDEQHQKLIELINDMIDIISPVMYSEKIISHLDVFLENLFNHFDHEEKVLSDIGYPDFDKHIKQHKKLIEECLRFKEKYHKEELGYSDFFTVVIDDILIGHFVNEDVQFSTYIRNKDII